MDRFELQGIVDDLSQRLGRPTSLTDAKLNSLVFGPHNGEQIDEVRRTTLLTRKTPTWVREWFESYGTLTTEVPIRIPADPGRNAFSRVVVPVRWRGTTYGFLCILDQEHRLDETQLDDVMKIAEEIGLLLQQERQSRRTDAASLRALLGQVVDERNRAAEQLAGRGYFSARSPVTVVVLQRWSTSEDSGEEQRLDNLLWEAGGATWRDLAYYAEPTQMVMLASLPKSRDVSRAAGFAMDAVQRCRQANDGALNVVSGIGEPQSTLGEAHIALRQARFAARIALLLPETGPVAEWSRLGALRALASVPDGELSAVIDPRLDRLLTSDDETLLPTLEAYLDGGCNAHSTARLLTIHRGTLYYRLRKAENLSGLDLTNGMDRLAMHVGLKAHRLSRGT